MRNSDDYYTVPVSDLALPDIYQVMPPLSTEEYGGLKNHIRENGVLTPIVLAVDPRNAVIDGHHRVRACRELGIETIPAQRFDPDAGESPRDLAWKLNMQRRHLGDGEKKARIEDYILDLSGREGDTHKTDTEIADVLGVSDSWVSEVRKSMVESGTIAGDGDFTTQQSVRERIAEALDDDPESSDRAVAERVGNTTHPTVGRVRRGGAAARRRRPRVFRHRPYLDSRAQEYLNQAARRIARREPEWVEDPSDPSVADCLRELRERAPGASEHDRPSSGGSVVDAEENDSSTRTETSGDDPDSTDGTGIRGPFATTQTTDTGLIVDFLAAGLDYQEVIYWMLYEYDGLDPVEVYHASSNKQKSYSYNLDRHAIRNVEAVLASAAEKLGTEFVVERSEYMYDPAE